MIEKEITFKEIEKIKYSDYTEDHGEILVKFKHYKFLIKEVKSIPCGNCHGVGMVGSSQLDGDDCTICQGTGKKHNP